MEIKEYHDDFFNAKRIQIYNSYIPYYLMEMKRYYIKNNISCIEAADTDLDVYLRHFSNVKYIYLHPDAVHLEEVNKLTNLNGISLSNNQLKYIDDEILEKIEYLQIDYIDKKHVDFSKFTSLKYLRLLDYPFDAINISNELLGFEINRAFKLVNLTGVNTKNLTKLKLENLTKLESINLVCPNLESFYIYDSKKVSNIETFLSTCKSLYEITITSYSDLNANLKSINFITGLHSLKYFRTSFRILDGDLKPLLNLKDVNIGTFYRNYNLKDKDLPHIYVWINDGYYAEKIRLDSLELGKEDPRIFWSK